MYKNIVGDLVGFDDHNLRFLIVHRHTCIREEILEDSKLLTKIIGIPCHKNNIIGIEKNDDYYISKSWSNTTYGFQTIF